MLALALSLISLHQSPKISRDDYGVPHISAPSLTEAFYDAGYAVAQDRLWQMENSRRLTRGRLAEAFGKAYAASDKQILSTGYTDAELRQQIDSLSPDAWEALDNYSRGVNAYIEDARKSASLPSGYADAGIKPEPWTPEDSAAIAIWLLQQFGRGGAGEIRNLALLTYLGNQPNAKGKELDIFDDFLWQNDARATPTIAPSDDKLVKVKPFFPNPSRAETQAQIANLPKVNLFELLPGLQLADLRETKRIAEARNVVFKTGSYCVVVGGKRSGTGKPLLLSGPQMGFRTPSIVHEMSIETPEFKVAGMDIPGVPGVVVGMTPTIAWGLTSGVADTDDIFVFKAKGKDEYEFGGKALTLERIERTLKVKGEADQKVTESRTLFGPVVLTAGDARSYFARRSSYRMKELQTLNSFLSLYRAKDPTDVESAMSSTTMNFNFFYATTKGDIGYHYVGLVPVRAKGLDPRLPTPAESKFDWQGMVPFGSMPHVLNPATSLLANWNNKPVSWWPNLDTPAWGRVFRNNVLLSQLTKPKLSAQDLELAAWSIARLGDTWQDFKSYALMGAADSPEALAYLKAYDGRLMDGSQGASLYNRFLASLRSELFLGTTGNFMSEDLFALAAQPSVVLNALEKKTKVDYLRGRTVAEVTKKAMDDAYQSLVTQRGPSAANWGYSAPTISVPGQPGIPYSNRGTYIQIIELGPVMRGRNVLPPGVAESGPHAFDQVPLARAWTYKEMVRF